MTRIIWTSLLLTGYSFTLSAQATKDFEITLPETKITNSLYRSIKYIDSRFDTTHMGIVQLGAFNRKAKVVPKISLSTQLEKVLGAITDESAANGELLFQLRQLSFAEVTGAMSEKGYCYFRADLYAKKDNAYQKLATSDTVILVKTMDVTKALFRNGSKTITDFVANNLHTETSASRSYTIDDIVRIDSIEKSEIPVYNTDKYIDGIYNTYAAFKIQAPDGQVIVETKKDGSIRSVKKAGDNGSTDKIKSKDVYALVYNGQPYAATDYGFYRLMKVDNDFFFFGEAKVTANSSDVVAASVFFGVIGGLLASNAHATFEIKIDHTNGGHIPLREIVTPSAP